MVEKPLFSKVQNYRSKTNKIYVGYNLRFDPIIEYLKNKLKNRTVNYINLSCLSHLPSWRKILIYKKSYILIIEKVVALPMIFLMKLTP